MNSGYTVPSMKKMTVSQFYDYENQIVDYEDLKDLNEAISSARSALFQLTDQINKAERIETRAKTAYNRAWRRAYMSSSEKTDQGRKSRADLACEHLEDDLIVASQVKSELIRSCNSVRMELQTLQTVASNFRQQIKM